MGDINLNNRGVASISEELHSNSLPVCLQSTAKFQLEGRKERKDIMNSHSFSSMGLMAFYFS